MPFYKTLPWFEERKIIEIHEAQGARLNNKEQNLHEPNEDGQESAVMKGGSRM